MQKRTNKLMDLMSWLLKQYRDILESAAKNYPFRIIDEKQQARTGKTVFVVQFAGKNTCARLIANKLADNDTLIQGFPPQDVKKIMSAALGRKRFNVLAGGLANAPCKIIAKNFDRQNKKIQYVIEETNQYNVKSTRTLDLEELAKSKDLLLKFSKLDIYELAFNAGTASALRTHDEVVLCKKNK